MNHPEQRQPSPSKRYSGKSRSERAGVANPNKAGNGAYAKTIVDRAKFLKKLPIKDLSAYSTEKKGM